MRMKVYNEKKLAVLQATMKLLRQDVSPDRLKVADIAAAAGIGKGTVYEYFNTKDEIVLEALVYSLQCVFEEILKVLRQPQDLRETVRILFPFIHSGFENSWYILLTLYSRRRGELPVTCCFSDCPMKEQQEAIQEILELIYQKAVAAGASRQTDKVYLRMCVIGALTAYIQEMHIQGIAATLHAKAGGGDMALENAYQMLLRSLS